jgi:hypothetical protein
VIPGAGGVIDPQSQKIHTTARRSASKVMATVTPSITQLLGMFGIFRGLGNTFDSYIESTSQSQFGSSLSTALNTPHIHAVTRMMKGLPAAWIFTDLRCQDVEYQQTASSKKTRGVEVRLIYHRSAKMPFVGSLMWMLHKLQDFATFGGVTDDGTNGPIRVDPLNYGFVVNDPLNSSQVNAAKERLLHIITAKSIEISTRVKEKSNELNHEFLNTSHPNSPPIFGQIAFQAFDTLSDKLTSWSTQANAQDAVNWIAEASLNLFLAAPDELKTIPISVSVRLPNLNQAYENREQPWAGSATLLGNFTNHTNMARLAKGLVETMDKANPPNSQTGLPYAKE